MARKSLSKRTRFSVFARDSFTCRYCGRQSDQVKLVIDHVIPVCEGGSSDEINLVTSCEECNQGKSGKLLENAAPSESDRLARLQDLREQKSIAAAAIEAMRAESEARQSLVNFWCESVGRTSVSTSTIGVIYSYAKEFGFSTLCDWISIAAMRTGQGSDTNMGKYISGIRRKVIEQREAA